jgi:hypothetical protein
VSNTSQRADVIRYRWPEYWLPGRKMTDFWNGLATLLAAPDFEDVVAW